MTTRLECSRQCGHGIKMPPGVRLEIRSSFCFSLQLLFNLAAERHSSVLRAVDQDASGSCIVPLIQSEEQLLPWQCLIEGSALTRLRPVVRTESVDKGRVPAKPA
jgi:hypothetical protein